MEKSLSIYDSNNNQIELQIDEIKKFIAPTATEQEFWLFIQTAKMLNLNPIKREIHFAKFGGQAQIITGYQVYLERAIRSGLLEYWNVEVEKPSDKRETWIGVFTAKRTDWTQPFEWRVPMIEVDKKQATWNLMPEFLLKKNTLSQGLRMLIPEILSGMPYTAEEVTAGSSEMVLERNAIDQKATYTEVVKPSESEQKTFDDDKDSRFQKVKAEIDGITDIANLDAWVAKNVQKIGKSDLKDAINEYIVARTSEIERKQEAETKPEPVDSELDALDEGEQELDVNNS
jgi:hypothetical protein